MARKRRAPRIAAEYEDLLANSDPSYSFPDFDENARATTFYTTGTTGLPKGVYYSHRQLVLHTMAVGRALADAPHGCFTKDDVYMPITPMFHVHAWGLPYLATMLGAKQVYPGRYIPDRLVNLICQEKVTFSHCVPTILQMVMAAADAKSVSLAGWKVVIGGAALPHAFAKEALEKGIDIYAGYGMSETCPVLTLSHLKPEMLEWDLDRQAEARRTWRGGRSRSFRSASWTRRCRTFRMTGSLRARSLCGHRGSPKAI